MTNHRLNVERDMSELRIGVGLPAAIPGAPGQAVVEWAARAEELDFASLGVIDRLVYDNQDPLVALAAAAAVTERAELVTTVLNVPWRQNSLMLAKQMASLDRLSGGRLVAGLGLGGWPEDYRESGLDLAGRGPVFDAMLDVMGRAWAGQVVGAAGPMPGTAPGRPELLFGGFAARSFKRAAALGTGWVAPLFGHQLLVDGIAKCREAWSQAGRTDSARILTGRYVCLGPDAETKADQYIEHYYGPQFFPMARADTLSSEPHVESELKRLRDAGTTDVVLYPCSADVDQLHRLATVLDRVGFGPTTRARA